MESLVIATVIGGLVGAVISMITGMIWYGPVFGKNWAAVIGMDMNDSAKMAEMKKGMMPLYLLSFITNFIMFFIFTNVSLLAGQLTFLGTIVFAFFMWLGFIMPIEVGNAMWSGKPKHLARSMFYLTGGYQLLNIFLVAVAWYFILPMFL